jgi:hypothetical protein
MCTILHLSGRSTLIARSAAPIRPPIAARWPPSWRMLGAPSPDPPRALAPAASAL